jgi:hypothetical protein
MIGEAWASPGDGQGVAMVLVAVGEGGLFSAFQVVYALDGGILDGMAVTRAWPGIQEIVRDCADAGLLLAEVPVAEAACLVQSAAARHRAAGLAMPPDAVHPVERLESWPGSPVFAPAPAAGASLGELRALLAREPHDRWFFGPSELAGTPPATGSLEAWYAHAAASLAEPLRARTRALVRHAAWWWSRNDDPEAAALLAAAADDLARDFATAPLVRVMLEKTAELAGGTLELPRPPLYLVPKD